MTSKELEAVRVEYHTELALQRAGAARMFRRARRRRLEESGEIPAAPAMPDPDEGFGGRFD